MLLKTVYEKAVMQGATISAVGCVTAFNHFTGYLLARYGDKLVCEPNSAYADATTVDDDVPVRPSYESAYVDYIVGENTKNEARQADAVAKAEYAWRTEWRASAKGKRIRKERWL